MTNAEKRDLRVWAFEMVNRRPPKATRINAEVLFEDLSLLEQIADADTLAKWATDGEIKL